MQSLPMEEQPKRIIVSREDMLDPPEVRHAGRELTMPVC